MLSKTDKSKYRSLLFRHLDGISLLGPISQLDKTGLANFINESESFTLGDINSFKECNLGYMNVTLHLLICQGWLKKINNIYIKTENGKIAFQNFGSYTPIYPYMNKLVNCHKTLFDNKESNNYIKEILLIIKNYSEKNRKNDINNQIYHHLIGTLVGPILVSIGMSEHYKFILNANKLSQTKQIFNNDTYNYLIELFKYLRWINNDESFTNKGLFYIKRASAYGVTTSYLPIYSFIETVLFDNVKEIWRKIDGKEQHVNRVMNVWGSGGAHTTYFKRIHDIIIDIFNQPLENQPKGIADMGCGDGTLLIHLHDIIKNKTFRGKYLDKYPLLIIGADFNIEAQQTSLKNLNNAGIDCIILNGDISDPSDFNRTLNSKYNLNLDDLLNVRSFLDHNRVYKEPRGNDIKKSISTGAYSYRGKLISNIELEQNLLEHLKSWKPYIDKHGLLILELHCLNPYIITKNIGITASTAYESTHGYSDQYIVNLECFLKLANKAGLKPIRKYQLKFPDNELSNISINLFK